MLSNSTQLRGDLLVLAAASIWGVAFYFQKTAMLHVEPLLFIGLRGAVAAATLLPFAIHEQRASQTHLKHIVPVALLAGALFFIAGIVQQYGADHMFCQVKNHGPATVCEYQDIVHRGGRQAGDPGNAVADRKQVALTRPIKELGLHTVLVNLHPEVVVEIELNVARSVEEAELQASGKSIQELAAEAEAAADFEIAELFDDIGSAALDDDEGDAAPATDESEEGSEEA